MGLAKLGTPVAVRVDQVLELPDNIINWMERTIIDLPANGVAGIHLQTASGERIDLERSAATEPLKLKLKGGDQKELAHSVQQLVFGLTQLNFDELNRPYKDQAAYLLSYRLFDGSEIELKLFSEDGNWSTGSWALLKVLGPSQPISGSDLTIQSQENRDLVIQMNQHLSRWSYHLSPQRTSLYIQAINEVFQ
jgi:hypothetical protein